MTGQVDRLRLVGNHARQTILAGRDAPRARCRAAGSGAIAGRLRAAAQRIDMTLDTLAAAAPGSAHEDAGARALLSRATRDVHERMHHHAGFAAVTDGSITREHYRSLMARSYGFHLVFEQLTDQPAVRSARLHADLLALGFASDEIERMPSCNLSPFASAAARLGARYVIEGSAIGGRVLARGLYHILGCGMVSGRTFLVGDGAQTGKTWSRFLGQLEAGLETPSCRRAAVDGAQDTFAAFEVWMEDWTIDI